MQQPSDSIDLLTDVTTGTSDPVPIAQYPRVGGSVRFATGVTAGAVVYETAPTYNYSGTWSEVFTITFAGTAPNVVTDVAEVAANFIRARVTTAISGGGAPKATVTLNRMAR